MKNSHKKFASKRLMLKYKRKLKIREKISGDSNRPRLSVVRSEKHISCQVIDDTAGKTLVAASSFETNSKHARANKEVCYKIGQTIAKRCIEKKINNLVFDRNGCLFHGRIAQLAKGIRDSGLSF
jgi:large subunit ribosomal protein L18